MIPHLDVEKACDQIVREYTDFLSKTWVRRPVVGISGGIDSAVAAALSLRATRKFNTQPPVLVHLPMDHCSSNDSLLRARELAVSLGLYMKEVSITSIVRACDIAFSNVGILGRSYVSDKFQLGNIMARVRMISLWALARAESGFVVGTGNRTETLLGYCTLHGDDACIINPLAGLYKQWVYELAEYLKISESIIKAPPSAELWSGQTDEQELGFSYEIADEVCYAHDHLNYPLQEVTQSIKDVIAQINRTSFKREVPYNLGTKLPLAL